MTPNSRLDTLDATTHDLEDVLRRLNEFVALPEEEQEALLDRASEDVTHELAWAGVYDMAHPLTDFLPELPEPEVVVRDCDGSLKLIVAGASPDNGWGSVLLCQSHLGGSWHDSLNDPDAAEWLEDELEAAFGQHATLELLRSIVNDLPESPSSSA